MEVLCGQGEAFINIFKFTYYILHILIYVIYIFCFILSDRVGIWYTSLDYYDFQEIYSYMAEETYYLIDFENVGLKGLEGAEKLSAQDHVHLFSTRNAPKINTATLATFNGKNLVVHEVPAKSQSVDMHLVSYLGYLLGKHDPAPAIVILSNDTDYDDIVQFWKTELNVIVVRWDHFEDPKPSAPKKAAGKAKPAGKAAAKENAPASEKAPAAREKAPAKEKAPAAREKAPAKEKALKTVEPKDKTAVNNAVLKTLSAAKYDNEIVSFCASQVTKLFTEKNGKQLIYRSIISKYGQEQGLEIYRQIKKLL